MGTFYCREKPLKDEDLDRLEQTYMLMKHEILQLYRKWVSYGGLYYSEPKRVMSDILIKQCKPLRKHPWSKRICFVFASYRDPLSGLSVLTFDDYLKMVSAFHFRTPIDIKYYWAFKLYDFDNDQLLSLSDVHRCVRIIVGPTMTDEEIKEICYRVFNETDLDGDNKLTAGEFAAVVKKFDKFETNFTMKFI
mmetsp:Transcript_17880/g.21947  ORF Transcript_17880/g.21947 Transcript_17880/m.21947 type:complete len:192 (-) Transcript_17880:66-641(-)